jgi:hypothetical protein
MTALAEVRAALQRAPLPEPEPTTPDGPETALDRLAAVFGLSRFEQRLLVLAAAPELDSSFAQLCATAQGDPLRAYPTLSLALAVLPEAHWSALSPGAPLRRWRMIEIGAGNALTTSPIRIDERVLHYLTGVFAPEPRLAGIVAPIEWSGALAPSHAKLAEQIVQAWSGESSPPVVQLRGDGAAIKRAIAATAAGRGNLRLSVASIQAIPTAPHETEALMRLWEREAALDGRALLIEADDYDFSDGPRTAAVTRLIDRTEGVVLVAVREPRRFGTRPAVGLEVPALSATEQHGVWLSALGDAGAGLNGQIELLSSQFNLTADAIHRAAADARGRTEPGDAAELPVRLGRALWDVCRELARPRLEDLAQRIDSAPAWDDLVLPEAQRQVLREIGAHVRQRAVVYERWGFAKRGARGLGISALFAGASGTGKTMAAEVLAHDLGLDLYRIDLSAVVSKYIGETEKNLRRIFDAAEEGGAVLLFDEADALFGKRSEVKDSHDRYANIEVSYLLQRMESYRGLAVLTTNMRSALDTAFLRRLRFVVQFPFPDQQHRAEIWRRIFPSGTPLDGVDPDRLARLNVAGGNIRNIALNAAFMAADAGEPVRMTHLLRATRSEYAKLEKPLTEAEIGGWDERASPAPEIRVR